MILLNLVESGDKVAILSPSSGIAGIFPWVADYGLSRMKALFGLQPIEYPTTRKFGSSLIDRANDINAAFSDPDIRAVFSMIGGDDQIQLLKYLDLKKIKSNPKPFFGYSDNTHLCNFLFNLGIPSFYGGSIMTEFGFNNALPEITLKSIKWALSERGQKDITASSDFNTIGLPWDKKALLDQEREFEKNQGYVWNGQNAAEGTLWGGCVESLVALTAAGNDEVLHQPRSDIILFLETSEAMPPHWVIKYYLIGLGERGSFGKNIKGVVVGRPKTWDFEKQTTKPERKKYFQDQADAIINTIRNYHGSMPIVLNVDIGHTAPQYIVPMGNKCNINPVQKKLQFEY